ncbi:uncharacterized protein LOC122530180 [Frieseomelitta varia]|uniref:uncharacterized protein LOC122530180 n=1 Tax=Frieseomelitta varia TaxID=561572 RepID=UPI001CB6B53C|nr:uncharacterized protein LOC122530180 [Frieseomelitta varia]
MRNLQQQKQRRPRHEKQKRRRRTLRFRENPNTIPETHGSQPLNPTPYQHTSRQSSSWTRRPGQMPGYQRWKQCVLTTRRDATPLCEASPPRLVLSVQFLSRAISRLRHERPERTTFLADTGENRAIDPTSLPRRNVRSFEATCGR